MMQIFHGWKTVTWSWAQAYPMKHQKPQHQRHLEPPVKAQRYMPIEPWLKMNFGSFNTANCTLQTPNPANSANCKKFAICPRGCGKCPRTKSLCLACRSFYFLDSHPNWRYWSPKMHSNESCHICDVIHIFCGCLEQSPCKTGPPWFFCANFCAFANQWADFFLPAREGFNLHSALQIAVVHPPDRQICQRTVLEVRRHMTAKAI